MANELSTYVATDLEEADAAQKELDQHREERKRFNNKLKLQVGKNVIRVMPPRADYPKRWPIHSLYVHYVPNPQQPGKGGRPYACPLKNGNKACEVCKAVQALNRSGSDIDRDAAKRISAKQEWYVNAVDTFNPDKGVQVLSFGVTIYEKLLKLMKAPTDDDPVAVGDITHPDHGYNIVIEKTQDPKDIKNSTRYETNAAKRPTPIANREWLTQLHDLRTAAVDSISAEKALAIMEGKDEAPPADAAPAPSAEDDLYDPPVRGGK